MSNGLEFTLKVSYYVHAQIFIYLFAFCSFFYFV